MSGQHNYFMATQDHQQRLMAVGELVLEQMRPLVELLYPEGGGDDMNRAITLGRELGMALMLAGRGDVAVNRTGLIEGLGHAIGECVAQQPVQVGGVIRVAMMRGLNDGFRAASQAFAPGGAA